VANKLKSLPDIIPSRNCRILFIGTNPGLKSVTVGHYFPGGSNVFWKLLYKSGLTKRLLKPEQDKQLAYYGYGLTDIVKIPTKSQSDIREKYTFYHALKLHRRLNMHRPKIAAFIGKKGFQIFIQDKKAKLHYGFQFRYNRHTRIFLLPSTSGQSYRDTRLDEKLKWFLDLKRKMR